MLLKNGDSGVQVKYLQQGLRIMCCNPGTIDSVFGAGTQAAVQKFQNDQGISADGIVGDETWNCLIAEIKPIQQALKNKGFYTGAITGIARESTYDAVISFQESRQLAADGMVGAATRERLFDESTGDEEEDMLPLTIGSRGDYVLNLQYGLRILCCSPGALDGVFGSGTEAAVRKFQGKYNLSENGIVNAATWNRLKAEIRAIQEQLEDKGYGIARIDGLATSALVETIKSFQEDNWLTADGQVGPSTYDILFSDMESGATDAFPLVVGSRGPQVLYFQYGLRINCFNPNGTDGVFGNGMRSAVNRYKAGKQLPEDGTVDVETWEAMRADIRPIQTALSGRGYAVGFIDGIATEAVYEAVLQFQRDHNLTADGMVGSSTKALLLGGTSGGGTVSSTLRTGSNGSLVRYLQRMLQELEYDVTVDGIFGQSTHNAIIDFQQKHALDADGVVGGGTWRELFAAYHVDVAGTGIEKMVNVAKHELEWGFAEDNANNITPYGQWYGLNGNAWCAMFVSFCADQAGVVDAMVPKYSWCPSGMTWYKNRQKYHKRNSGYVPKIGDIIFFYNNELGRVAHTGIVVGGDEDYVVTIEGNTSIDAVEERTYSLTHSTIDGYGDNGGEPIWESLPPTEEEIETVLMEYFKEFLDDLNLVIPSTSIELNKEYTIPMTSFAKVVVSASTEVSIFDNIAANSGAVSIDITNGMQLSAGVNIGDYLAFAVAGLEDIVDVTVLKQILLDFSLTVDTGQTLMGLGVMTDEEGQWAYIEEGTKMSVEIKPDYPAVDFVIKRTYCVKMENPMESVLEPIYNFVEEHPFEVVGCAILFVAAAYIIGTGTISLAGLAALGSALLQLVQNVLGLLPSLPRI